MELGEDGLVSPLLLVGNKADLSPTSNSRFATIKPRTGDIERIYRMSFSKPTDNGIVKIFSLLIE